jgi:hypothetical protein
MKSDSRQGQNGRADEGGGGERKQGQHEWIKEDETREIRMKQRNGGRKKGNENNIKELRKDETIQM